jgi:hypothetical protein
MREQLYWNFVFFRRKSIRVKLNSSYSNSILPQAEEAASSVGQGHSSDEFSVMERERRALVICVKLF